MTSPSPKYAVSIEELNKFSIKDLLEDIRRKVLERSSFGIRILSRIYKEMELKGYKHLDVDDFRWGLMDYGIVTNKEEAQKILEHFDTTGNGLVDYDKFLKALRVSYSSHLIKNIERAIRI